MLPANNDLIELALRGAAILLLGHAVVLLARRTSAATRHLMMMLCVLALGALPLMWLTLPRVAVLPTAWTVHESSPATTNAATTVDEPVEMATALTATPRPAPTTPVNANPAVEAAEPATPVGAPEARWDWTAWIAPIWLAGVATTLLPVALGAVMLRQLTRSCERVTDGHWLALLDQSKAQLGLRRSVTLLRSMDRAMPMTWGWFSAKLLIPAEADDWSTAKRRAVLLHELAHVKRRDCLLATACHAACAMHWFNPLAWWALAKLRNLREQACDDAVLTATADGSDLRGSDYAQQLLEVASNLRSPVVSSYASIAMARRSSLEGRVLAILDPRRNRAAVTRRRAAIGTMLLCAVAVPITILSAAEPQTHDRSEVRAVAEFDEVLIEIAADVRITPGDTVTCRVEADPDTLALIKTDVKRDQLRIWSSKNVTRGVTVTLEMPALKNLTINGSGDVTIDDMTHHALTLEIHGSGDVRAVGSAEELTIEVDGSGDMKLTELVSQDADVKINGSGNVDLSVTQTLRATINGSGDIRYRGEPENVRQSINGSGNIRKVPGAVPPSTQPAVSNTNGVTATVGDVTFELIGLSEHPSQGNAWWKPDGSPLDEAPYDRLRTGRLDADGERYEIAVGFAADPQLDVKSYLAFPTAHRSYSTLDTEKNGRDVAGLIGGAFAIAEDKQLESTSIIVGVAQGPWETIYTIEGTSGSAEGGNGRDYNIAIAPPYAHNGGVRVTAALTTPQLTQARLVAIDRDGATHIPTGDVSTSGGAARQLTCDFRGLALEKVEGFALQTRPFRQVEFIDVSLRPGHATQPRIATTRRAEGDVESAVATIAQCAEGDPRIKAAMESLKPLPAAEVVRELAAHLDENDAAQRRAAIYVLWRGPYIDLGDATAKLMALTESNEPFTAGMAALTLGEKKIAAAYDRLATLTLEADDGYVRRCAAYALGSLGNPRAEDVLNAATKDNDPLVAGNAKAALKMLKAQADAAAQAWRVTQSLGNPIQTMHHDLRPGGMVRFEQRIEQPNRADAPVTSISFRNSDFVEIEAMNDPDGKPLKFDVEHTGSHYNYRVTLNHPVAPGDTIAYATEGMLHELVTQPEPGVFAYRMTHWPGGRGMTRRIETHLLPAGAVLLEKSENLAQSEKDGRVLLSLNTMIQDGGNETVTYRYRLDDVEAGE